MRLTLTNESMTFTQQGVYIQPLNSEGFWFNGSAHELISILVYHHEIDIEHATFRVRISQIDADTAHKMEGQSRG